MFTITFRVALPQVLLSLSTTFLGKDHFQTTEGIQPQGSLPGALRWGGGGPGSVLLKSTLLAKSPLGGEEGSGGRRSQILLLTNAIQVCASLNSALGSFSDGHHLSRFLQILFGAAGVCQGLEKIGSSPSSFSLLLVVSERPEPGGKIHVFIEMLLLCRGVVFLSLFFLKKNKNKNKKNPKLKNLVCLDMKPKREMSL